jgi:hypothetical protein
MMEMHMLVDNKMRAPEALLARQRAAFLHDGPPALAQRRADLVKLKRGLLSRRQELGRVIAADFGYRSAADRTFLEFVTLIQGINLRLPRCEGSRARCAHRSGRSARSCGADLRSTARLRTTWQLANVRIRPGLEGRQGGCRMAMPLSGV